MSAFMDALRSCTGLSGPYSCSNGPLRSSSLRAEKAGRPSGRPVVEGERALSWTRCAFIHMTRTIKEHRFSLLLLLCLLCFLLRPPSPSLFPTFSHPQTERRGLIVCCESQRLQSLPSFFLLCLFLLFFKPPTPFLKSVILSQRQGKKSTGIFLRNVDMRESRTPTVGAGDCVFGGESRAGSLFQFIRQLLSVFEVFMELENVCNSCTSHAQIFTCTFLYHFLSYHRKFWDKCLGPRPPAINQ